LNKTLTTANHYHQQVHDRIEALLPILAKAAIGDYSRDVPPLTSPDDEFNELYVGIQLMLEAMREKLSQLDSLTTDLEDIVAARTTELYNSEARYRSVAETANDAIITIDNQGIITYLNRAAEIIFGQTAAQALGHPLTQLIPDLRPSYLKIQPVSPLKTGHELGKLIHATAQHPSGHTFPVEISLAAWQNGSRIFITAIIRDLTVHQLLVNKLAQRTAELKQRVSDQTRLLRTRLAESERDKAEDEALLGSIGEGVMAVDRDGKIFFANREFARMTSTTTTRVKGRYYYTVVNLENEAGEPLPRPERPIEAVLTSGRPITTQDYFYRTRQGRTFPVSISAAPIVLKGKIIGAIEVIRDITKEKEVDRLKSEFVSLASHQLRTPATAVKGLLSLLLEGYNGELTKPQLGSLTQAYSENEHQLKLIDDMLDVAKLDAGELTLELTQLDIGRLIRSVVKEQHNVIRGRRQNLKVTPLPGAKVWADAGKLQMVFDNLIANASKYTREGGQIRITMERSPQFYTVSIQDNGIGIAPRDTANLFKRFSRAGNASRSHSSGTGLGLYLSKKIMDLHHGRIEVVSTLGRGSTFTVIIPRQQGATKK
jgi:PAS domain S-box-containing protein